MWLTWILLRIFANDNLFVTSKTTWISQSRGNTYNWYWYVRFNIGAQKGRTTALCWSECINVMLEALRKPRYLSVLHRIILGVHLWHFESLRQPFPVAPIIIFTTTRWRCKGRIGWASASWPRCPGFECPLVTHVLCSSFHCLVCTDVFVDPPLVPQIVIIAKIPVIPNYRDLCFEIKAISVCRKITIDCQGEICDFVAV